MIATNKENKKSSICVVFYQNTILSGQKPKRRNLRNQVERNIINCLLLKNCSPPHFSRFLDLTKLETNDSR